MSQVHGQIESLKRIRETLDQKGITRFNSIGDLNNFLKNYESEKEELLFRIEREFDLDLEILKAKDRVLRNEYDDVKKTTKDRLNLRLSTLREKCTFLSSKPAKNAVIELAYWYQLQFFLGYKFILERAIPLIIWRRTHRIKKKLVAAKMQLHEFVSKRQKIISKRYAPQFEKLSHTKNVVSSLNTTIAGAIGEHLVEKELKKLNGPFVLINDFSITFKNPIFWRQKNDLIFSIQIDHLLVTRGGIFIIETKNWSKESIKRLDVRSPIKQIRRTQHALFVILNSKNSNVHSNLKQHHWGQKKLNVRSIVAMINNKPEGEFKFVTIKKLIELNSYIEFYEPVFDDAEVKSIGEYLMKLKN